MKFRNPIPYPQILNFLQERNISINYFFYGSSPKDQLVVKSVSLSLAMEKAWSHL